MIELTPDGFLPDGTTMPRMMALVFGPPKSGKTTLAGEFPRQSKSSLLYVPTDPEADRLRGFSRKLAPNDDRVMVPPASLGSKGMYTWLMETFTKDWAADGVDLIIWDTMSQSAQDVLVEAAYTQVFSEKHITFGSGNFRAPVPQRGDYQAAQVAITNLTAALRTLQRKCNVLVLAHDGYSDVRDSESGMGETIGGPKSVGTAMIGSYPSTFSNVIRTTSRHNADSRKTQFFAWIEAHSIFGSVGVRRPRDIPAVLKSKTDVTDTPAQFWAMLREHIGDTGTDA